MAGYVMLMDGVIVKALTQRVEYGQAVYAWSRSCEVKSQARQIACGLVA